MLTRLKAIRAVCCAPEIWAAHLERAEKHFASVAEKYIGGEIERDIFGDAIPRMEIRGDAAVIPVVGVLASGLPSIAAAFGYVDPEDIEDELDEAMANDAVKSIFLYCDSPGGMVEGIAELAAKVASIQAGNQKPIYAYASNCDSSAYYICAGATAIIAKGSGSIGSIGVYSTFTDTTGMLEQMGLKVMKFASGLLKGAGVDGKLSEAQAANIQERVDYLAGKFKAHVKQFRNIADEDMQGQWFDGDQGAAKGFADGVANSLEAAMKLFAK